MPKPVVILKGGFWEGQLVCGPRTYLAKTGHKTRYVHVDRLIKAHDKVPNEIGELDIPVPELCEPSNL